MDPRLKALRSVIKALFPELAGYQHPIRARVVAVHEAGGAMTEYAPRYTVDVQPLRPDWSIDPERPTIPDVEIPVVWAGPNRGVYCLPAVGAIVRVAWYYGDPAHPYVDAILGYGFNCPDHPAGSFIIQASDGTKIVINPDESILIQSSGEVHISCRQATVSASVKAIVDAPLVEIAGNAHPAAWGDIVKAIFDAHVHPVGAGTTGPPTAAMDGHASDKVKLG